jgi:uncharacterized Rossmann fold enzyme
VCKLDYLEWEPIYRQILDDFGFKEAEDKTAANVLKDLLVPKIKIKISELSNLISNKQVHIFGAGPNLESEIKNNTFEGVIIAADGATSELMMNDIIPNIIVTDLDGHIPDQITANEQGAILIVHAHGDNIPALKSWVPKFQGNILGTTQAKPNEEHEIYNFGGFTDGDRAIFLASHCNAKKINLVAFNFNEIGKNKIYYKNDSSTKLRKLTWANLLIGMIKKPPITFQPAIE